LKVLVTGAAGFLGRHVVAALRARGTQVRALVRPGTDVQDRRWDDGVDVFEADLRTHPGLHASLDGVDAVVHLAARVTGTDDQRFQSTVAGTERLLAAVALSHSRRVVLASSYAVYDWSRAEGVLDEQTPLEADLYARDGYAVAKVWQERVARRAATAQGFELTVLRPGFIWGPGNEWVDGIGQRVGRVVLAIGPLKRLPLTYVENCADLFAEAAADPRAAGATLNVVDCTGVPTWRYAREFGTVVPVPYRMAFAGVRATDALASFAFGERRRLPSILVPKRFEARFKPVQHASAAERVLGWHPPVPFDEALRRTRTHG
jgi:nucleoside-diphosphate-sugar epimerase